MTRHRKQAEPRLGRRAARRIGDLHEQIRLALSGRDPGTTAPRIRIQYDGAQTATCELWGLIRAEPPLGDRMKLACLASLTAGIGMRRQHIEKAAENAGFDFDRTEVEGRATWRRRDIGPDSGCYELELKSVTSPLVKGRLLLERPTTTDPGGTQ